MRMHSQLPFSAAAADGVLSDGIVAVEADLSDLNRTASPGRQSQHFRKLLAYFAGHVTYSRKATRPLSEKTFDQQVHEITSM
jgi:hypothetical protein